MASAGRPAATMANANPPPPATSATTVAARRLTSPQAMGFQGFAARSIGSSTRSLTVPMQNCRPSMPAARSAALSVPPPASSASPNTSALLRTDGNGWTSRSALISRATPDLDVDQLVEGFDQEIGQARPRIGQQRPRPGDEVAQ